MLRYMHQKGWVHHDISYGNILIDGDGRARLNDLEFAEKYNCNNKSHSIVSCRFA